MQSKVSWIILKSKELYAARTLFVAITNPTTAFAYQLKVPNFFRPYSATKYAVGLRLLCIIDKEH